MRSAGACLVATVPQPTPLDVVCIQRIEELLGLRDAWRELLDHSEGVSVFQTLEATLALLKYYGTDAEPLVLLAYSSGHLVAAAPLVLLRKRLLGRWRRVVQFIGTHHVSYLGFVIHTDYPDALDALLAYLHELERRWDLLYLVDVEEGSPLLDIGPESLARLGHPAIVTPLDQISLYQPGDVEADRKLLRKRNADRAERRLGRIGRIDCHASTSLDEALEFAEAFFALHIARWSTTDTPSVYRDERHKELIRDLLRTLVPAGMACMWILTHDGLPIAAHVVMEYRGRLELYRTTYALDYADYAPGLVMLKSILVDALARKLCEISFGSGTAPHKEHYRNRVVYSSALRAYRRRQAYWLDRLALGARRRLAPLILSSPVLRPIGHYVRLHWPDLNL